MKAELHDGRIVLTETTYFDKDRIKQIPGARYRDGTWTLRLSWPALWQMRNLLAPEIGPELLAWVDEQWSTRIAPALALRADADDLTVECQDERLSHLQRVGVDFLRVAGRCILGDQMGSGKTVQACVAMETSPDIERAIVVCPNSVKSVWAEHVREWTTMPVHLAGKTAPQRRKAIAAWEDEGGVLIINYEAAWRHTRLAGYGSMKLKRCEECGARPGEEPVPEAKCEVHPRELNGVPADLVILDEAHRVKDPKSKQTRGVWAISRPATYRWALTGTPIANDPSEFWTLLHFTDPEAWPARTAFIDRYCEVSWTPWGGDIVGLNQLNREEFFHATDPVFLRRRTADIVGKETPKRYLVREVALSRDQRRIYKELKAELVAMIDGGAVVALNGLEETTRLLQIASAGLRAEQDPDTGETRYRLAEPSSKLDELERVLEDLGPDEPLIVFAESRQLIELAAARLTKRGITHAMVTGAVPAAERQGEVDAFQAGHSRVFLATYGAAAEGLTLTRARYTCYLQRSWNLVSNQQSERRFDRWGQEADELYIIDIVAEDTIEARVHEAYGDKSAMLAEVCQDPAAFKEAL